MNKPNALLALIFVSFAGAAMAAELRSEWIEPNVGSSESLLGARIHSIEDLPDAAGQRVVIEIPRESLQYRDDIPEIVITARRRDSTEWQLDIPHEWVSDYDNDHYGLVLYLGRDQNLPLRLFLKTDR